MIKLASWNVNSLTVRLEQVLAWIDGADIDILALQETKLTDDKFPVQAFVDKGFQVVFSGQKTYNGVAIISKRPITEVVTDFPDLVDPQRRILAATIGSVRLINFYIPNGSELGSDKYHYKLTWLNAAKMFLQQQLKQYPRLAVVGDFNIAPADSDVHDPNAWNGCTLVSAPERQAFADFIALGLYDSFRQFPQEALSFSWWDYRAAGFRRNAGLRIDHILLSEPLMLQCSASVIDKNPRQSDRPSDHAPIWVSLD